jgi:hypothetical protein
MAELGGTNVIGGASVSIEGNTDKLRQSLAEARREAEAFERKPIRVPIEVDVRRVVSDFQRLTAELQKTVQPITIPVVFGSPGGGGGGAGGGGGGGVGIGAGGGNFFNQFNQLNQQANFSSTSNRLAFSSRTINTVNNTVNNAPGPGGGGGTPGLGGGGRGFLSAYGIARLATVGVEAGVAALDYAHYAGTGNLAAQVRIAEQTTQQIQQLPFGVGALGIGIAELGDFPGIDEFMAHPMGGFKGRRTQRHEIEDIMEEDTRRNARMDVIQSRLERSRSFGEAAATTTRDLATEAAEVGMTPAQRVLASHRNQVVDFERAAERTRQFTARGDTDEVKGERAALGGKDLRLSQNVQREAETQMATHQQRMRDIALAGEEGRAAAEGRVRQAELISLKRDLAARQAALEAAQRALANLPANATPQARRAAADAVAEAQGGVNLAGQAMGNAAFAQGRDTTRDVYATESQAAASRLRTGRQFRAADLLAFQSTSIGSDRAAEGRRESPNEANAADAYAAGMSNALTRMREESVEFFQSMTGRRETAALVGQGRGHSAGIIADAYAGAREIRETEPSRQAEVRKTINAEMGASKALVMRQAASARSTEYDPRYDVIGAPTAKEGVNDVLKSFDRAGNIINGRPNADDVDPQVYRDIKVATETAAEALKTLITIFSQGFAPQLP